jgi:hypothetical protein
MVRQLLRVSAAIAFAACLAPGTPDAAPAPGLMYDEIVRVLVNASPPPAGTFQTDLAAVQAATPAPALTPAPRRRGIGGLGNIAGAVLSGNPNAIAAATAGQVASNALDAALQRSLGAQFGALAAAANQFLQPHLLRYAYWNGWERVDDVATQTATIRKCDLGQVIRLDLARKTYTIATPDTETAVVATPSPRRPERATPRSPEPPGTGVASFTSSTRSLGAQRIEGQSTEGYTTTTTFAMTQATGSCRNGSAGFESVEYLAPIARPPVNQCPLRRAPIPETPVDAAVAPSGGCRPTFTAQRSGPTPPANRLSLYSLVRVSSGSGAKPQPGSSGIGFLTERGNLKTLAASDAGLFEIPQGFTKAP